MSPTNRQIPKRYSPVRRSSACIATPVTARLACVRHAASVQSEPGSNSSLKGFETIQVTRASNKLYWLIGYSSSCCASQRTDASPHTNYLFRFLKSGLRAGPRQKRDFNRFSWSVNTSKHRGDHFPEARHARFVTVVSREAAHLTDGKPRVNTLFSTSNCARKFARISQTHVVPTRKMFNLESANTTVGAQIKGYEGA